MVNNNDITIGFDRRKDFCYAAKVRREVGRPLVERLLKFDNDHRPEKELRESARMIYAVPDNEVIVKNITLDPAETNRVELKARFELAQCLLEDECDFQFETIHTGIENKFIGTIIRNQLICSYNRGIMKNGPVGDNRDDLKTDYAPIYSGCIRAVSLGRGYLTFCHRERGELMVLADFNEEIVSICFIYRDNIIGLGYMMLSGFNLEEESYIEKLAVEFKTLINFKLASFHKDGITIPLSGLFLSGENVIEQVKRAIAPFFAVPVKSPRINTGYFPEPSQFSSIPLNDYLVSLGSACK